MAELTKVFGFRLGFTDVVGSNLWVEQRGANSRHPFDTMLKIWRLTKFDWYTNITKSGESKFGSDVVDTLRSIWRKISGTNASIRLEVPWGDRRLSLVDKFLGKTGPYHVGEWRCLASFFDGKSYLTTWANWRLVPRTLRCSILTRDVKDISGFDGHTKATMSALISQNFDGTMVAKSFGAHPGLLNMMVWQNFSFWAY